MQECNGVKSVHRSTERESKRQTDESALSQEIPTSQVSRTHFLQAPLVGHNNHSLLWSSKIGGSWCSTCWLSSQLMVFTSAAVIALSKSCSVAKHKRHRVARLVLAQHVAELFFRIHNPLTIFTVDDVNQAVRHLVVGTPQTLGLVLASGTHTIKLKFLPR